jgi:enolase
LGFIEHADIRKILDSRGNPTVEVDVYAGAGMGTAAAPSGASTGIHEVKAFPEGGVDQGIKLFREKVLPELIGMWVFDQREIDAVLHEVDGTDDFSLIGGNIAVAASLAVAKTAADASDLPLYYYLGGMNAYCLPKPMGNVLGGGRHAVGGTDIQEFLVLPFAPSVRDAVFGNAMVHKLVKEKLKQKCPSAALGKGDEGAWVAAISNEEGLAVVSEACQEASSKLDFDIHPALDVAASEFFKDGKYTYKDKTITEDEQVEYMARLVDEFGIKSLEDPLDQESYAAYAALTKDIGKKCLVVGDDLFVTNIKRLSQGIGMGAANAILIKPNQIGTLTDTVNAIKTAYAAGYEAIVSHRSGETTDDTIAHIGAGFEAFGLKTGVVGGERTAKLNELIRIEEIIIGAEE